MLIEGKRVMIRLREILFAAMAVVAIGPVFAQDRKTLDDTWTLGPRIGMNISSFSGATSGTKTGPAAGISVNYQKQRCGLSTELLYSFKGGISDHSSEGMHSSRSTELRYLEIPVHGIYYFNTGERLRPKIGAGAYVQVLTGGKETILSGVDTTTYDPNVTEVNGLRYGTFDMGLSATAGFNFKFWEDAWISTDLRYAHGVIDIAYETSHRVMNRNWAVIVGVGFPLDRSNFKRQ